MENNLSLTGLLLTAALVALGVTNPANATLFFSDDFAYANGDLAGNSGGTGWQAASVWTGGMGSNGNQVADPLPGMSGKSIQIARNASETTRPLGATYTSGGATTYYISFAFNATPFQGDGGKYAGVSVFLAADRSNNLLGGMPGGSGALGFDWTNRFDPSASGVNGTTYLALLEIKPGVVEGDPVVNTSLNMYVTTDLSMNGATLAASTPWVAAGLDPGFSFDSVGIAGSYSTGTIGFAGLAMADNPNEAVSFTQTAVNSVPTATTSAASSITTTGATLGGTVNANGASTTVSFDYGITVSYGTNTAATPSSIAASAGSTPVTAILTGLTCNTTYHFRVKAVNSAGTTNGGDQSFTTSACPSPTLSVTNTPQTYTGSAIAAVVSCSSSGAVSNIKYGGNSTAPTSVGTNAVTANCAANGNYSAVTDASAGNLVINPAIQAALSVVSTPSSLNVDTSSSLSTTGGSGNGVVTYSLVSGPCTLAAGTAILTGTGAGSCVVTATKAADTNYTSVTSAPITVTVAGPPPVLNLVATAGPGYIRLDFSSSTPAFAAITSTVQSGSSVIYTGTCVSSDGGVTASATGPSSPITVTGVTAGKLYTCTVIGTDGSGSSAPSNPSNDVTPLPPPSPPQPIPTLSEWAQLMMMLAMIAMAGFYGWRMKQR